MKNILLLFFIGILGFNSSAQVQETAIGCTYYDLQTNGSINNSLVVNSDGTISAIWMTSPDSIVTTNPPYPNRGSGYNFWDGASWVNAVPQCPSDRVETFRTGFPNIVVTSSGAELIIAHGSSGNYNRIAVSRRSTKGSGAWSISYPWGNTSHDTWSKACSAGTNVYAVWDGSGSGAITTSTPPIVLGQAGPIFFSRSIDDGVNWDPKVVPPPLDSSNYLGFQADSYAIDAKDSIVVIGYGDKYSDVGIVKSYDYGLTWTKTIVQQHLMPFYTPCMSTDTNNDGIPDTLLTNGGDINVLIDNNGMVHAWFSKLRYYSDSAECNFLSFTSDGLEYWNESLGPNNYVEIATARDFNSNGKIDYPTDTFTNCIKQLPFGNYGRGITIMPSAGIDASGTIYLTYATVNELADTTTYHELRRHIYMMTLSPPYNVSNWTFPYDIIPSMAVGGYGEFQEGAYACVGRNVDNNYAYVLYQRDQYPGHSQGTANSCDQIFNYGNASDIILAKIDKLLVSAATLNPSELFVGQNFPNPANGMTFINIGLKRSSDIRFEIYDIVGRIVYSENRQRLQTGNHKISFDTKKLKPGVYNYTVIAEGLRATKRMIVEH